MIVGFTGTQKGMTLLQVHKLKQLLNALQPEKVRHGGCIGADIDFHQLASSMGIPTIVHLSDIYSKHGCLVPEATTVQAAKPPLERNRIIVDLSDILIAAPKSSKEELRSGTWATVRYAVKKHKSCFVVYPSGVVVLTTNKEG